MSNLEKQIYLAERLLDYMVQGYRPFDIDAAIRTILRVIIAIGRHILNKEKE